MENNLLSKRAYQKQYRVAGIVIFLVSVLALIARIFVYYLSDFFIEMEEYMSEFVLDAIFTFIMQILVLFIMPLLIYKFALKKSINDVFKFSNFGKTKAINYPLSVILGILGIVVTIGISFFWVIIVSIFGYTPSSSATLYPENFNIWIFLGSMVFTAVLPGFCEEFTMRGGFLTALRSALPIATVITVSAFAFGLFHQYIMQVFYTAFFGALTAFLTIRTKSIFPAMIVHFFNNGMNVYLGYAEKYGWIGKNFYNNISTMMLDGRLGVLLLIYIIIVVVYVLLLRLIAKLNPKDVPLPIMQDGNPPDISRSSEQPAQFYGASSYDKYTVKKAPPLQINKKIPPRPIMSPGHMLNPYETNILSQGKQRIMFVNGSYFLLENGYLYSLKLKPIYQPKIRDNIFYIAAIVVSVLSTIFTFIWGL